MVPDLNSDIQLAIRLAQRGSNVAMEQFQAGQIGVSAKEDLSPISSADIATEKAMLEILTKHRPQDAVLSEESGMKGEGRRQWILDPIDGTRQYLLGLPNWATMVALQEDEEIIACAICAPALNQQWWATQGGGAWNNGHRIYVSDKSQLEDATMQHADLKAWDNFGGHSPLLELSSKCYQTMGVGTFWMHCLVAEGRADIALQPGPEIWDFAAPSLLVQEAGGRFSALDGKPEPEHGTGLSTNGLLHEQVLEVLSGFEIKKMEKE